MTLSRRILLAAILTLGIGVGYWIYGAWPSWFGETIYMDASLGMRDPRSSRVGVEFPGARLAVDLPGAPAADNPAPHIVVRQIGPVWPAGSDWARGARRFHGRELYVQVESRGEAPPGGRRIVEPVSVSTTPIEGATNLRVRVTRVEPSGRFQIALGPPAFPAPPRIADGPLMAELKVLPSGRSSMVNLVSR